MKKMIRRILSLTAVFALAFCLVSCGKDSGPQTVAGEYELSGLKYAEDDSEAADSEGLFGRLVLKEDGTGTLNLFGSQMDVTYDDSAKTLATAQAEAAYTFEKNTLEFSLDGSFIYVFKKVK